MISILMQAKGGSGLSPTVAVVATAPVIGGVQCTAVATTAAAPNCVAGRAVTLRGRAFDNATVLQFAGPSQAACPTIAVTIGGLPGATVTLDDGASHYCPPLESPAK